MDKQTENKDLFGAREFSVQTIEAIGKFLQLKEKFRIKHSFDPYVTKAIRREYESKYSMYYKGDGVELRFSVEVGSRDVYTRHAASVRGRMTSIKELSDILNKHKYLIS